MIDIYFWSDGLLPIDRRKCLFYKLLAHSRPFSSVCCTKTKAHNKLTAWPNTNPYSLISRKWRTQRNPPCSSVLGRSGRWKGKETHPPSAAAIMPCQKAMRVTRYGRRILQRRYSIENSRWDHPPGTPAPCFFGILAGVPGLMMRIWSMIWLGFDGYVHNWFLSLFLFP
jgi:hypothetical protein